MAITEAVRALIPRLVAGDVGSALTCFSDVAVVETPLSGRVTPLEWVVTECGWLTCGGLTVEEVNTVMVESRVAHEIVVVLPDTGGPREVLMLLFAEGTSDRIDALYEFYRSDVIDTLCRAVPVRRPDSAACRTPSYTSR